MQVPRQDEGVATIVARSAQKEDAPRLEIAVDPLQGLEQLQAGVLHEDDLGHAELPGGAPVDTTHLLRGQDFHVHGPRGVAHFTQVGCRNQGTGLPGCRTGVDSVARGLG